MLWGFDPVSTNGALTESEAFCVHSAHCSYTCAGKDCATECHLYIPERRQVHKVSADMLNGHMRQPVQLKEDKEYVPVDHSAIVSLKEDCGFAATTTSVGMLMLPTIP